MIQIGIALCLLVFVLVRIRNLRKCWAFGYYNYPAVKTDRFHTWVYPGYIGGNARDRRRIKRRGCVCVPLGDGGKAGRWHRRPKSIRFRLLAPGGFNEKDFQEVIEQVWKESAEGRFQPMSALCLSIEARAWARRHDEKEKSRRAGRTA